MPTSLKYTEDRTKNTEKKPSASFLGAFSRPTFAFLPITYY